MLHLLIFIPLLVALAILLGAPARKCALVAAIAELAISFLAVLSYDRVKGGFGFLSTTAIAHEWGLNYSVGADGLSLVMLLLTGIVTFAAIWVAPPVARRENLYYACLLFITAGAAGAFAS